MTRLSICKKCPYRNESNYACSMYGKVEGICCNKDMHAYSPGYVGQFNALDGEVLSPYFKIPDACPFRLEHLLVNL